MAMNYVGKLLTNFKGFYNEINSATLTGAIDVIIVQQEDGTYLSSPWHVRFGKMGVLRAREKVVDIEINNKPVDLHMKLGEAGEAFFIQEAEETGEMPAHLATSPLPDSLELMEEGLRELHTQGTVLMTDSQTNTDLDLLPAGPTILSVLDLPPTGPNIVSVVSDDSLTQANSSQYFSTVSVVVETENKDKIDSLHASSLQDSTEHSAATTVTIDSVAHGNNKMASDMATQTDMTGTEAETISKTRSSANLAALVPSGGEETPRPAVVIDKKSSSSVEPPEQRQKRRRRRSHRTREVLKESGNRLEVVTSSTGSGSSADYPEEAIFDLDLEDEDLDHMNSMGRTVSMPMIEAKNRRVDEWANNQYASHLHPFSDGDITPVISPVSSRPPSPKSDTELDTAHHDHIMDATSQTQLTGDDMQPIDTLTWHWGEIPECSSSQEQQQTLQSVPISSKDAKPSSGLFHFMRQTKKIRHQPDQGGIYLDDLNLEQMDPEVTALYLYNKQSSTPSGAMRTLQDEDTESGRGASLPQSPVTVQKEPLELDPIQHRVFPFLPDVSMSLCGGLKDVEAEKCPDNFSQFLVTYDSFCENPAVLSNPNLVIRIGDKFYNWQIASPIIMSCLVFQQPLPEIMVEQLIHTHLPKKERRRGWFSWVRSGAEQQASGEKKAPDGTSPPSSAPSSTPNSPQKKKERKEKTRVRHIKDGFETDEESDGSSNRSGQHEQPSQSQAEVRHEVTEDVFRQDSNTQTHKHKKTLKLSSAEIQKLGLQFGMNEASFSVTTQYQGTSRCNCFIYVWKWDDKIIVSDIDGTITKSDVLGQVFPLIGKDWSQAGVANLYQFINSNGYRFLYLSARAIGQSKITRDYLKSIRQSNLGLPDGPLLLSPSSLISAFHREVIERKPEEFKIGCLRDIAALFPKNPLYAGFGNKINDVWAYRAVDIPSTRIFTVNPKGELKAENNLTFMSSYTKLGDIADHFFPALRHTKSGKIHVGNFPGSEQYSTFTYWREPLPNIDQEINAVLKGATASQRK